MAKQAPSNLAVKLPLKIIFSNIGEFVPKLKIGTVAATLMLLLSTPAISQPSEGIKALIQTPASAFDVFLSQLYLQLNGAPYFATPNFEDSLRVFKIEYNSSQNVINIGIHIGQKNKLITGFSSLSENEKKIALTSAAQSIAASMGLTAEGTPLPVRYGLIQMIKIRNGWGDKSIENRLKDEIADRIALQIVYAWEEKYAYIVERNPAGKYTYSLIKK